MHFVRTSYDVDLPDDTGATVPHSSEEGDEEDGSAGAPMWSGTASSAHSSAPPGSGSDAMEHGSAGEQRRRQASSSGSAHEVSSAVEGSAEAGLPRPNVAGPKGAAPRRAPVVPGSGGNTTGFVGGTNSGNPSHHRHHKPLAKNLTPQKKD